jgi:glycosyltransferase involved in cell wall biosynthesis
MERKGGRPRIAVFTKQLDNWRSGSGHHLNEIMTETLRQNEGRFDFTFMHYAPSDNPLYAGVRELIVPRNPLKFAAILRRERFDLVHYTPLTIYSPIWFVPNKKVATIHGVEQLLLPQFFGKAEMFHERVLVPIFARRMDGILTVSEKTKRYLVEHFNVRDERVVVAYNGIGGKYRKYEASEITAPERFGVSRPFVFHISRFSERKNPWVLLEAFSRFVSKTGSAHALVCAGNGWDSAAVRKRAEELGIGDRLFTPGFIPEVDAAECLSAADFFVFPSLAEGFGMPNIEAMACRCPVITTAAFAVAEIVGDAAIVIDDAKDIQGLADAMAQLASDSALKAKLVARAQARIDLFSWDAAAHTLLDLYERVLR